MSDKKKGRAAGTAAARGAGSNAEFNFSDENIKIENEGQDSDSLYDPFIVKVKGEGGDQVVLCLSEVQVKALLEIFSNYVKGRDAIKALKKTVSVQSS
jgi:hypothetical protein